MSDTPMPSAPPRKHVRAAAQAALGAVAMVTAGVGTVQAQAPATGFGPPKPIAQRAEAIDLVGATVAPTGRTAVMWRSADFTRGIYEYRVTAGPTPDALGGEQGVAAGTSVASNGGGAQLLGFPDGRLAACFVDDGRRHGNVTSGCAFAGSDGVFGPLRVVDRRSWKQRPTLSAAVRADGRLVLVLSRLSNRGRPVRSLLLDQSGKRTSKRAVATLTRSDTLSMTSLDDGTVALATTRGAKADDLGRPAVLQLMAPTATRFSRALKFTPDPLVEFGVGLTGGRGLAAAYSPGDDGRERPSSVVVRRADGSFARPRQLPRPGTGFLFGALTLLPGGSPFAVTAAQKVAVTDCSNVTASVVGAGPLVTSSKPATAERLSAPGQIADYPGVAALDDGTVLATWANAGDIADDLQLEVAIRAPGADRFGPARQVLPSVANGSYLLASGGNDAIIVWPSDRSAEDFSSTGVTASVLRRDAALAASAERPTRPVTSCS